MTAETTCGLYRYISGVLSLTDFSTLFVCLFNRSLRTETHLGPDGTRLKQNAQARLKSLYKHAGQLVCGNVKGVYRVAPSAT